MRLILSRHGNTFDANDKVVWVGAANDLPLVNSGLEQAKCFGQAIRQANLSVAAIFCGPLSRTREYAKIVKQSGPDHAGFGAPIIVDERLNELDYGKWSGQTDQEIKDQFGDVFQQWTEAGIWPNNSNWGQTEVEVIAQVQSFAADLIKQFDANADVVIVSSNGRLRYFLTLMENAYAKHLAEKKIKVKTGNICILSEANGKFLVDSWNVEPTDKLLIRPARM